MNRFYAAAVEVVCERAIIDKLVGDQIMALYLPRVFPGKPAQHMLANPRALMLAADHAVPAAHRELTLRGKSEPEVAFVERVDRAQSWSIRNARSMSPHGLDDG